MNFAAKAIRLFRRTGIGLFAVGLIMFIHAGCQVQEKEPVKPNVILVLTDDQGYGDLGIHGNPIIKTPVMDELYNESVRFTDFHVMPMCSPTRGQLLTGRDAMKNGCTAVCEGRSLVHPEIPTMANFFTNSGYATGHFGKWHMGDSYPFRPQDRGFQETLHFRAWGITSLADYWCNDYFDPMLVHNNEEKRYTGYCIDIFFNEAMKWMEKCQSDGKPFFTYLATNTPHIPEVVGNEYSEPYQEIGNYNGKEIPFDFYGMITNIDDNLGRLEQFLKDKGLRDNIIFIFMTDNGTQNKMAESIFNAGMRDRKTSIYEGGHRVPCFIRWPEGKLNYGTDVDKLTVVQDILPTLIEMCDLKSEKAQFDGLSLDKILKDKKAELNDRKLVIQYRFKGKDGKWDNTVVLWNKWRLTATDELYDISNDPHQDINVANKYPEIVKEMSDHYDNWFQRSCLSEGSGIISRAPTTNKPVK